ncbi:P-loop containing nucleoside triphosphate hydrolase protein [Scleroderma citrinum]
MLSALKFSRVLARSTGDTVTSCLHTSSILLSPARRKGRRGSSKTSAPPKNRLAKSLKVTGKAKRLGTLEVAPKSRPAFIRDKVPHEGKAPRERVSSRRRGDSETRRPDKPITTEQKHFAAIAHTERAGRRAEAARERRSVVINPLEQEFDISSRSSLGVVPKYFSSPPLLPGLRQCLHELIGENARPTAIQALSLKHLFKQRDSEERWTECLLASETGSGKSIAYLLPLLQDLKHREVGGSRPSGSSRRPLNPRALILAPTHELSRQLASFAKKLSHVIKLRIMCASRANVPSTAKERGTASKMKKLMSVLDNSDDAEIIIRNGERASHPVDVIVGTPMKLLELEKGRGWNWEQRARERALLINSNSALEPDGLQDASSIDLGHKFWVDEPEMGLENVEWVIVDEADILFDPDFQESTRTLLADIAAARGRSVPVTPLSTPAAQGVHLKSDLPQHISYPFNFLLTSATIPTSLSNYLSACHPTLTRLASPRLHHLPRGLRTEHASWTGGNKDADIERRIRRVWAEDALDHAKTARSGPVSLSKIIVFCNKRRKVEELGAFLDSRGVKSVALTGSAESRQRGSNHHLDGFLKRNPSSVSVPSTSSTTPVASSSDPAVIPHVLVTTSLLSRGLDFSPDIKHVFIVDEPRNMIDFLHRAGRTGRAGETGKVVVFGRSKGRGSGRAVEMRKRVGALSA